MSHCESPYYCIALGYEGATDSCLTLTFLGRTKEYCVESEAWRRLSKFWWRTPMNFKPCYIPKQSLRGSELTKIWDTLDEDLYGE